MSLEMKVNWRSMRYTRTLVIVISLLFGIVTFYFASPAFHSLATRCLIMALFATSLNLVIGYSGDIHLGHAAYFGAGAYATGIFLQKISPSVPLALLFGVVVGILLAMIFGSLAVRLGRIYYAMLTFAFAMLIYTIIIRGGNLTGGDQGLTGGLPREAISFGLFALDMSNLPHLYIFTFVLVLISLLMMKIIVDSPFGYIQRALRDNAERSGFIGINVRRRRWAIFVIAGAFAGLAGGLMALFVSGAYPDFASFIKCLDPVIMILVGGMYNFFGPLLGATIIVVLESYIAKYTSYWGLIVGMVILFLCIFARGGILDYLSQIQLPSIRTLLKR